MENMDPNNDPDGVSEEELILREVIQGDAELYYLHHYLSELLAGGENF